MDTKFLAVARQNSGMGGGMLSDERRLAAAELLNNADPAMVAEWLGLALARCPETQKRELRHLLGCGCDGSPKLDRDWVLKKLRDMACCDPNRRLSRLEEEQLRANDGDVIDLPTVQGNGQSQTVTVPAYGVPWYFTKFSVDGRVPDTGSLSKVQIEIVHADRVLSKFRVNQYYKNDCCETIIDEWKRYRRCFGYASTFKIVVTNLNANAGDTFSQGVFSWARGFPVDFDDLEIMNGAGGSCR